MQGSTPIELLYCEAWGVAEVSMLLATYPIERAIYSTVSVTQEDVVTLLQEQVSYTLLFDTDTHLPIELAYRTPHTLGRDRIAAVVGAQTDSPHVTSLVIDAGTAISYDLLEEGNLFVGGNIAPGVQMRLQALHTFTQRLPLVEPAGELPWLGVDTPTAIRSGVLRGVVYEIEGYIDTINDKYPDVLVFLTGGDAFLLAANLKNRIFVDKNLVLKGLNRILDYNAEK